MSDIRFVLCQGSAFLPAMVRLLARAVAVHLEDWAVFLDPNAASGGATLYRPGVPPLVLASAPMTATLTDVTNAVDAELMAAVQKPRSVQYLVLRTTDDAALTAYVGGNPAFFHVVTPIVGFNAGPTPPPGTTQWLLPLTGRIMPAILLPADKTGHAGTFQIYPIGVAWNAPNPPERDACRMRIDPVAAGIADATPSWANVDVTTRQTIERWARTITFRRVGVVISGGGASVFRLTRLFKAFENTPEGPLPIDLLGGVSGGTAFGAAYAVGGVAKVDELADQGGVFTLATLGTFANSWFTERFFDVFLAGCGVRNTEIRVVPLTTTLPPVDAPEAGVVVEGTFGEAVRASGGAPFFAPYFPNGGHTRMVDGAIMANVPPPLLAEQFGADIVFAANVLSTPATRFPGEDVPILGDILSIFYRYTLLGRVADTFGSVATMLHSLSEASGLTADDFVDTMPRNGTLVEPPLFYNAKVYAADGLDGVDFQLAAENWVKLWKMLP